MKKNIIVFIIMASMAIGFGAYKIFDLLISADRKISYSQDGEDLLLANIFGNLGIRTPTYIDIGANHPIRDSNTYYFYKKGSTGICIEPNPTLYKLHLKKRNRDIALNCGIGISDTKEADYYIIGEGDGSGWNTFSRDVAERAEKISKGKRKIERIIKMPMLNINNILNKYFSNKNPDLVSIDVEGLEFDILRTIDFEKYRPVVLCVETLLYGNIDRSVLAPISQALICLTV